MRKIKRGQIWQHKETGTLIVIEGFPETKRPNTCAVRIGENDQNFWMSNLWIVDQLDIPKLHVYIGDL